LPAPKKYDNPVITTLRLERESKKIADALHISLADSLAIGLSCQIRMRINDEDPRVTAEIIRSFRELETKDLSQIEDYVRVKKAEQVALDHYVELKKESERPERSIVVYASDIEETIEIPESQFDSRYHTRKGASK
jgi:hypothetical protein